MNHKKLLGAASVALLFVIVILILILPPGIWAASKYKELHKFRGKDGAYPQAGLIFDAAGNLYGTTPTGGDLTACLGSSPGCGVVFKLTPNADGSWTEHVIHKFKGLDGSAPVAPLIFDGSGNLYGTTLSGGNAGQGTVFKLAPNPAGGWKESVLYSFQAENDGFSPEAGVVFDAAGNLYGTTNTDRPYYNGEIFELAPNPDGTWTYNVLWAFADYREGSWLYGGIVFDAEGNLYTTTSLGTDHGEVFELTPNGEWSIPHTFKGRNDGKFPHAGLIFDAAGNLYGTTYLGGNHNFCKGQGCGTVFELSPNGDGTWKEKVLHSFSGAKGAGPQAGLIFDRAGNLYGTASTGGKDGGGVAFKLSPKPGGSWAYSVLHVFQGKPALNPYSSLVLDQAGNLYGTALACALTNCKGVVFEITP